MSTCTRHDPALRYPSVDALMADVQRHMDGHPIAARPASLGYRFRKFVRRNRRLAPAAGLIVLLTAGYVAMVSMQSARLEQERNRAQDNARRSEALRALLVEQFEAADPWGSDPARARQVTMVQALLGAATAAQEELASEPLLLAGILSDVADVLESLDLREDAVALLEEAMTLRADAGQARSIDQLDDLGLLAELVAGVSTDSARFLAERRLTWEREHAEPQDARVALALGGLARLENIAGRYDHADSLLQAGIALLRRSDPAGPALARQLEDHAVALAGLEKLSVAEEAVREALVIRRGLVSEEHPTVAVTEEHLAQVLSQAGRLEESAELHRRALRKLEATLGPGHSTTIATMNNLGNALSGLGDLDGAVEIHRALLARVETNAPREVRSTASSLQNLAAALVRSGSFEEADSLSERAGRLFADAYGPRHYTVGFTMLTRAEIKLLQGDAAAAAGLGGAAARLLGAALPEGHYAVSVADCRQAAGWARSGREAEAVPQARAALEHLGASTVAPERLVRECAAIVDDATRRQAAAR